MTVTIVSGHRRSGTSVMMQALRAGIEYGTLVWGTTDKKNGNIERNGYIPNPGPILEVGGSYRKAEWLRENMVDDTVVKIFFDGLPNLPLGDYRVIFMVRDEWEINDSCAKTDKHLRSVNIPENPASGNTFYVYRPYSQDDIDHVLGICEARSDIQLIKVNYSDLIKHPTHELATLKLLGVPLNVRRAASVIDPSYYRSKK